MHRFGKRVFSHAYGSSSAFVNPGYVLESSGELLKLLISKASAPCTSDLSGWGRGLGTNRFGFYFF